MWNKLHKIERRTYKLKKQISKNKNEKLCFNKSKKRWNNNKNKRISRARRNKKKLTKKITRLKKAI